ncbi:MAG: lysophospholipid acyltransferase family protein [Candidatus Omnitrophica bacterium]|nr:lysophospholipid acyltransferase family protein [Candidatus Omnitrophota bacterium]
MINWILYLIGRFVAVTFGRKVSYSIASFIGKLQFYFSIKDRRAVIHNMQRVTGLSDSKSINDISKKVFINFGQYLVEFFRFTLLDRDFIDNHIKIINKQFLDEALSAGHGVIIVSAHLGNWELGGAVVAKLGYPFYGVALSHAYPKVNDFFNNQRACCGVKIIPVGIALRRCSQLLKENKIVAFLGDRDFANAGVEVKFFGKKAFVPRGAAKFSLKTKALIVPTFLIKKNRGNFSLYFEKPISPFSDEGKLKTEQHLIEEYVKIIEAYIKQYPSQWYMFQPFFTS